MRNTKKDSARTCLVVLPYSPTKIRPRAISNVRRLARLGFDVEVICPGSRVERGEVLVLISEPNVRFIFVDQEHWFVKIFRLAFFLVRARPITYYFYFSREIYNRITERLLSRSWDLVFIERLPYFAAPISRTIFDQTDCFSVQTRLFRNLKTFKGLMYWVDSLLLPRFERRVYAHYKYLVVTTPLEVSRVIDNAGHMGGAEVISCQHDIQVEIGSVSIADLGDGSVSKSKLIGFHGKLSYEPNLRALSRLESLNHISEKEGIRIVVCGTAIPAAYNVAPSLSYLGYVDDISVYIRGLHCGIFPIKECVGIQNKVLECLAFGVPVIVSMEIYLSLPSPEDLKNILIFPVDIGVVGWEQVVTKIVCDINPSIEDRSIGINYIRQIMESGSIVFKSLVSEIVSANPASTLPETGPEGRDVSRIGRKSRT